MIRRLLAPALLLPGIAFASPALDEQEVAFVELINDYRAQHGLPCLSVSPTANVPADYMSRAMGEQGFFAHNEPPCEGTAPNQVCTGRDPFERMIDLGHEGWTTAGENLYAGSGLAAAAFESWRNSPGHDANMRNGAFTAMGIARVEVPGSEMRVYWTNVFSNHVDGSHDCNEGPPPVGFGGDEPGPDPQDPEPCLPPENELDPDGGWGIGLPGEDDCSEEGSAAGSAGDDDEGGCASAPGGPALLGLLALAGWRRRRCSVQSPPGGR